MYVYYKVGKVVECFKYTKHYKVSDLHFFRNGSDFIAIYGYQIRAI
jgi:hypothetical protein